MHMHMHMYVPSNPSVWAAMAQQAMVLTLFGHSGHRPRTGPSYSTSACPSAAASAVHSRACARAVRPASSAAGEKLIMAGCFFMVMVTL